MSIVPSTRPDARTRLARRFINPPEKKRSHSFVAGVLVDERTRSSDRESCLVCLQDRFERTWPAPAGTDTESTPSLERMPRFRLRPDGCASFPNPSKRRGGLLGGAARQPPERGLLAFQEALGDQERREIVDGPGRGQHPPRDGRGPPPWGGGPG